MVSLQKVEVMRSGDAGAEAEEVGDVHSERGVTACAGGATILGGTSVEPCRALGPSESGRLGPLPRNLKAHLSTMDKRSTIPTTRMKATIAPVLIPSASGSSRDGSKS